MKTQLLIARHGNTFKSTETPRRVGAHTDLPLVEFDKAKNIGLYLKKIFAPEKTYCSPLQRTQQTAVTALETAGLDTQQLILDERFREIDYGPDENQAEDQVIARIGKPAINAWNTHAQVPPGWKVDPKALRAEWLAFGKEIEADYLGKKVLVVTSNGIARFSPALCQSFPTHLSQNLPSQNLPSQNLPSQNLPSQNLKVGTGCLCLFEKEVGKDNWTLKFWNEKPLALLETKNQKD